MVIKKVEVENFRSLRSFAMECGRISVIIGANGCGKSNFLEALDLFYSPAADYSETDFYNGETSRPMVVRVTFGELSAAEEKLFRPYVEGGALTVEKVHEWPRGRGSERYYGSRLRCPEFDAVRKAEGAAAKRAVYNEIRAAAGFEELARWRSMGAAEDEMRGWEGNHLERCTRMKDDGQFFGFKEVGEARLERYTRFLLLPAVRDAAQDALEGKGSAYSELMDILVRNAIAASAGWKGLTCPQRLYHLLC